MRSRLGVSPTPVGSKGPTMDTVRTAGCWRGCRSMLKCASYGCRVVSSRAEFFLMKVAPTACEPAGTVTRAFRWFVDPFVRVVGGVGLQHEVLARPHREQIEAPPVERDLDVVRLRQALDVLVAIALQPNLDLVLAVGRKQVLDHRPAARAEGKPGDMVLLRPVGWNDHHPAPGRRQAAADRQSAHLLRRCKVALHQRGREPPGVHVVEAEGGVVARQERRHVDLEGQQVADGVAVLGPVQAAEGVRAARIRVGGGRGVERRLEVRDHAAVVGGVGPGARPGRHRAGPQLADDLLPQLGMAGDVGDVDAFERQAAGLEPVVVTGDAVAVEQGLLVGRSLPSRRRCGPLRGRRGDRYQPCQQQARRRRRPAHRGHLNLQTTARPALF